MKQAEMRQDQGQNQPGQQTRGVAVQPPLGEKTAQLEALIERSPQAVWQAKLAAMADASPAVIRQCRVSEMIQNGVPVAVPRESLGNPSGALDACQPAQLTSPTVEIVQRTQDDVGTYVYKNRQALRKNRYVKSVFKGCFNNGKFMDKWKEERIGEDGKKRKNVIVHLEEYLQTITDKKWTKALLENEAVSGKIRKDIFEAWNKGQETEDQLSRDLIADLERDVSTLKLDEGGGLKRSDSFTFGGSESVPNYLETLKMLTNTIVVETGTKKKSVPVTNSIRTAGLLIRAYGDKLNCTYRKAKTHFALDLGGAYGIYHDSKGNGDLFYYPLAEKKDEKGVYFQEGSSSKHTWDKLAGELDKSKHNKEANTRLTNVLMNKFEGKLDKQEVIAIGAMLADAKVSIQGWLVALEELNSHNFSSGNISELFGVTGNPLWKYSLNADRDENKKIPDDEKGRQAGLGYKQRSERSTVVSEDEDLGFDDEEEFLEEEEDLEEDLVEEEEIAEESSSVVKKTKNSHNGLL